MEPLLTVYCNLTIVRFINCFNSLICTMSRNQFYTHEYVATQVFLSYKAFFWWFFLVLGWDEMLRDYEEIIDFVLHTNIVSLSHS